MRSDLHSQKRVLTVARFSLHFWSERHSFFCSVTYILYLITLANHRSIMSCLTRVEIHCTIVWTVKYTVFSTSTIQINDSKWPHCVSIIARSRYSTWNAWQSIYMVLVSTYHMENSPVDCKQQKHPRSPRNHCKWYPMFHSHIPPLYHMCYHRHSDVWHHFDMGLQI